MLPCTLCHIVEVPARPGSVAWDKLGDTNCPIMMLGILTVLRIN